MPVDINIWRVVIGLFANTIQRAAVFHLTKCGDSALCSMLLFLVIDSIKEVFKQYLGTFFSFWPNGF